MNCRACYQSTSRSYIMLLICTCIQVWIIHEYIGAVDYIHLCYCGGTEVLQTFWHKMSCWHLFEEAKQVGPIASVWAVHIHMKTRVRQRKPDKELAQTLLCTVWVSWGSSKYQETGWKHDLIFSFLSFIQSHDLFSLTHKVWTSGVDGTHHIKPISRLWVDFKW